jgi:hypothetical protein
MGNAVINRILPPTLHHDECQQPAAVGLTQAQPSPFVSPSLAFDHHRSIPVGLFALLGCDAVPGDVFHIRPRPNRKPSVLTVYIRATVWARAIVNPFGAKDRAIGQRPGNKPSRLKAPTFGPTSPRGRSPSARIFGMATVLDPETTESIEPGTGGPFIRCPKCGWTPRAEDRWRCSCGHTWNTFDTGGVCPGCRYQWKITKCLRCKEWSAHSDWYAHK